jgi:hypothetical protein
MFVATAIHCFQGRHPKDVAQLHVLVSDIVANGLCNVCCA